MKSKTAPSVPRLLFALSATGCASDEGNDGAAYGLRGPFLVGYRQFEAAGALPIFADPCETMPFTDQLSDLERQFLCLDAAPWDRERSQRWIRHLSTAFLLDALGGDGRARAALAPGAVVEDGLGYVTTYR